MLDTEFVLEKFSLFSDLSLEVCERYRFLCDKGRDYVEKRLRQDVNADSTIDKERLCEAAAARAYCDYLMMKGGGVGSGDEVRVGDISLKSSSSESDRQAVDIREYFMAQVADLLEPEWTALLVVDS